jgi:hypothetical protein
MKMLTLELDFAKANVVVNKAAQKGSVAEPEASWLDAFYENAAGRILNLYESARIVAWHNYDREGPQFR